MPYYNREPKRRHDVDNHPHIFQGLPSKCVEFSRVCCLVQIIYVSLCSVPEGRMCGTLALKYLRLRNEA